MLHARLLEAAAEEEPPRELEVVNVLRVLAVLEQLEQLCIALLWRRADGLRRRGELRALGDGEDGGRAYGRRPS